MFIEDLKLEKHDRHNMHRSPPLYMGENFEIQYNCMAFERRVKREWRKKDDSFVKIN